MSHDPSEIILICWFAARETFIIIIITWDRSGPVNRCISSVWEIDVWVLPALLQRLKGWGVSLSVLRPYAAHCNQIGLHGCHPRRKPLLKMMHKKAHKQFAEDKQTKDMDYWNHVLWSDETKINLFGSDGVKSVWRKPGEEYKDKCVLPTVKHGGGSVMVWGCMSAAGTGELQFIEGTMNANMYCDILKQSMIPSLRRLGRRAVFQHDNDPKHTSKMLRVKVMDWLSMSPDLNPIEHLWGILKWRSARSLTSTSSVMSSWRSGRGLQWQLVKLWWTPCPRVLRHCCKIMVATQNIDTLDPLWTFSLRGVLTFVASGLDINGCVLSYFEGTANLHWYTSCTLTTLHCSKVSFLQCCRMKRYNKIFTKCEGCTHFCEILYIVVGRLDQKMPGPIFCPSPALLYMILNYMFMVSLNSTIKYTITMSLVALSSTLKNIAL